MRSGKPTRATIALDLRGEGVERLTHGVEEVPAQDEVLGRVAGEAELGQQHELRAAVPGLSIDSEIRRELPSMSPTVGSIWASARRRCVDSAMDQVWPHRRGEQTHPWLGLLCRACSGRSGTLAGAEAWS